MARSANGIAWPCAAAMPPMVGGYDQGTAIVTQLYTS